MSEKQVKVNKNVLRKERDRVISGFIANNPNGITEYAIVLMKKHKFTERVRFAASILRGTRK